MPTDTKYNATPINHAGTEKNTRSQTIKTESVASEKMVSQLSEGQVQRFTDY